jgi:lysine/ornithine N-monooxygenase
MGYEEAPQTSHGKAEQELSESAWRSTHIVNRMVFHERKHNISKHQAEQVASDGALPATNSNRPG